MLWAAIVLIIGLLTCFAWVAIRSAKLEAVWKTVEDDTPQPNVPPPPDRAKANAARA